MDRGRDRPAGDGTGEDGTLTSEEITALQERMEVFKADLLGDLAGLTEEMSWAQDQETSNRLRVLCDCLASAVSTCDDFIEALSCRDMPRFRRAAHMWAAHEAVWEHLDEQVEEPEVPPSFEPREGGI